MPGVIRVTLRPQALDRVQGRTVRQAERYVLSQPRFLHYVTHPEKATQFATYQAAQDWLNAHPGVYQDSIARTWVPIPETRPLT